MNEINRLRKKIDKIDLQILNLLNKRSKISENIGKEKRSKNLFRPERQANILKNLLKSDNEINPSFILAFWSSIFLSQIDIQGGIKLIMSKGIFKSNINTVYDYFSHNVDIITINNFKKALEKLSKEKNSLLILPYPSNNEQSKWWVSKEVEKFYAIAALPFFLKKKKFPSLVIISKYKPIIEKDCFILYKSKYLLKEKNLKLEIKSNGNYLYKSDYEIENKNLKLFGALPKSYEI